jgi:hypothetical protein
MIEGDCVAMCDSVLVGWMMSLNIKIFCYIERVSTVFLAGGAGPCGGTI